MEKLQLKCPYDSTVWSSEFDLSEHLAVAHYSIRGHFKAKYNCFCGKIIEYSVQDPKIVVHLVGHLRQTTDPDLRNKILGEIDTLTRRS